MVTTWLFQGTFFFDWLKNFTSTQTPDQYNPYWLNIYFNCEKSEILLKEVNDTYEGNPIAEEEENKIEKFDADFKNILKYK